MVTLNHSRSQGSHAPQILENVVILCFERCFSKQSSVIRLKSNNLAPPKFLGWLRHCLELSSAFGSSVLTWLRIPQRVLSKQPTRSSSAVAAQFWSPPNAYRAPLTVIYKKTFSTLCYISRSNGLQNKLRQLQTQFWQNQTRSQDLRFGGKYICRGETLFLLCLKQIFLNTTKFSRSQKIFGGTTPEFTSCLRIWAELLPESLP